MPLAAMNNVKKTTQGRQKIEIKKIENISNRQVTFSKRRGGLFKKASELCVLSGAEVAIIVKSPGKRTFAFGHPNADAVIDRYLAGAASPAPPTGNPVADNPVLQGFNRDYTSLSRQLEEEKKVSAAVIAGPARDCVFWWQEKDDHLGLEELQRFLAALEELKKTVGLKKNSTIRVDEFQLDALPPYDEYGGDIFTNLYDQCGGSIVPQGYDFEPETRAQS